MSEPMVNLFSVKQFEEFFWVCAKGRAEGPFLFFGLLGLKSVHRIYLEVRIGYATLLFSSCLV